MMSLPSLLPHISLGISLNDSWSQLLVVMGRCIISDKLLQASENTTTTLFQWPVTLCSLLHLLQCVFSQVYLIYVPV